MKSDLQLTTLEKKLAVKIKSRARLWIIYRWVGLVGSALLMLAGAIGIFTAFHYARSDTGALSSALLAISFISLSLVLMGYVLSTHIIAKWKDHAKDTLLIKLVESNLAETEKDNN